MRLTLLAALVLTAAAGVAADAPKNLVENGDFNATGKGTEGVVAGWRGGNDKVSVVDNNGDRFLRIKLEQKGTAYIEQYIKLQPDWAGFKISVEIRARNLVRGDQPYQSCMLQYIFTSGPDKIVGGWPKRLVVNDQDWTIMQDEVKIPEGVDLLRVQCWGLDCKGTFDFDNVVVTPILKK